LGKVLRKVLGKKTRGGEARRGEWKKESVPSNREERGPQGVENIPNHPFSGRFGIIGEYGVCGRGKAKDKKILL